MVTRTLGLAAGLALASEAFMIPSTISLPGFGADGEGEGEYRALRMPDNFPEALKNLHVGVSSPAQQEPSTRILLDCPGCSFLEEDTPNVLSLDIGVSKDKKSLNLNGHPLFPLSAQDAVLTAHQEAIDDASLVSEDRRLMYTAGARSIAAADGSDAQLINLFLQINGLDEEDITVDGVDIRLLQSESGDLHVVHTVTTPPLGLPQNGHTVAVHPTMDQEACPEGPMTPSLLLCRLRNTIKTKLADFHLRRPCPKMRFHGDAPPGTFRAPFLRGGPMKFAGNAGFKPREGVPHHFHDPEQHEQVRSFVHAFASALRAFVFGLVVPILIGVVAGMSASLLGMVVGTLIAWLWVKLVRGGKRGRASTANQDARSREVMEEGEVVVGEKDGLLDHAPAFEESEAPPTYVEKE